MGDGDIQVVTTTRTRWSSLLANQRQQNGLAAVDSQWCADSGVCIDGSFGGNYFFTFEGDNHTFYPGHGSLGLKYGIFGIDAGLLRGGSPAGSVFFNDPMFLGGRVRLGEPFFNWETHGGWKQSTIWENGVPTLFGDGYVFGTSLGGAMEFVSGRVGYEHEIDSGGDSAGNQLSYLVNLRPGTDRLILNSAGEFLLLNEEGYQISAGTQIEAVKDVFGIGLSFRRYDRVPPFKLPGIEELVPRLEDNRGRVELSLTPVSWLNTTVAAEVGEHLWAGELGVNTPYVSAWVLYQNDHDLSDEDLNEMLGQSVTASLHGKIPIIDNVLLVGPYAALHYQDTSDFSQERTILGGGGRMSWAPLDQLTISASGGVTSLDGLIGGNLGLTLMGTFGASSTPSVTSSPNGSNRISYSQISASPPSRVRAAAVSRPNGVRLKEIAPGFSHAVAEHTKDSCSTCHSSDGGIRMAKEMLENECESCHYPTREAAIAEGVGTGFYDIFYAGEFASMPNHSSTAGWDCSQCHDTTAMAQLTAPTGGEGTIIIYPHITEIKNVSGVWPHQSRDDGTCTTCHDGQTQYQGHVVPTCGSCHTPASPNGSVTGSHHPDGWRISHIGQGRSKAEGCTSCHQHQSFSDCRSCHMQESIKPIGIHDGLGINRILLRGAYQGTMKHGVAYRRSGGTRCAPCHDVSSSSSTCASAACHGGGR